MSTNPFSFLTGLKSSEITTPFINYSYIFDQLNGEDVKGVDGRFYLNGGMTPNNAVVGGSNTQKSGMLVLLMARALSRIGCSVGFFFDIEKTFAVSRVAECVNRDVGIHNYFEDSLLDKRFFYFNGNQYDGTDVHDFFKNNNKLIKEELKKNKNLKVATPFASNDGVSPLMMFPPMVPHIDSGTELGFAKALAEFREGDVDEGGAKKTRDMVIGNLRRIVHSDADQLGGEVGMYQSWTAQVQDIINMTGQPLEKQTTFLRQGKKIAGPKTMKNLPGLGIEIIRGAPLKNGPDWLYPDPFGKDEVFDTDGKASPDLMEYFVSPYRNKSGVSGGQTSFIGSQALGIQEDLTAYHNLKKHKFFGYDSDNTRSHSLVLYPGSKLGRTTIRGQINEDLCLRRALCITYQYMNKVKYDLALDPKYRLSIEDFYEKINKLMDWEWILNETVDYWFINPDIKKKTLSTFELMRIAVGEGDPKF